MITTITLNPAVDRTCELSCLQVGDVNKMRSSKDCAGGKGVNVAKVLRQFHLQVAALGFIGGNTGKLIEETCEDMAIDCRFTKIGAQTRTNTTLVTDDGRITELLEPGPVVSEAELAAFYHIFDDTLVETEIMVLSGSIPGGIPMNIYKDLIFRCNAAGCKVFLDTSKEMLREGISAGPYLIKPNLAELEYLVGRKLSSHEEIFEEAAKILDKGVKKIVVSLGKEGMIYVDADHRLFEASIPVRVWNTVGCGDTSVASFVMSELSRDEAQIALHKAVALASANAMTEDSASVNMNAYMNLL